MTMSICDPCTYYLAGVSAAMWWGTARQGWHLKIIDGNPMPLRWKSGTRMKIAVMSSITGEDA